MDLLIAYLNSIGSEYSIECSDDIIYSNNFKQLETCEIISNNICEYNNNFYQKSTKILNYNDIDYTIILYSDITKFAKEIIKSKTDCLTKLPNRTQIEKNLSKIDYECVVVMCDIDDFKRVNDIYGHQVGDSIIKLVGDLIRSSISENDFAGRYGGEEFLLIFGTTDEFEVKRKMDEFNAFLNSKTKPINISMSTGIYKFNPNIEHVSSAIRKADEALYYVKHNGKNACMIYDKINQKQKVKNTSI